MKKEFSIEFDSTTSKMLLFDHLRGLSGTYNVTLERPKEKRSNNQSRYFHGVVVRYIANETGDDYLSTKEDLKAMFLSYQEEKYGTTITKIRSTAELTTVEFNEFNEQCCNWAYHYLNLIIPLPNEVID